MIPTLFVSYRKIPGFTPGLHRINGKIIVFSAGLTSNSTKEEFAQVMPEIRWRISTDLYLPSIPRAVVYVGTQLREEMQALALELLPRERTRIVACRCDFEKKQAFATGHRLQLTLCECDGGGPTMARLIDEARKWDA